MITEEKDKEQEQSYQQQIDNLPTFDYDGFSKKYQSGEKPLLEALMGGYVKPEQRITPEQEKKAKRAAALSDGLVSLAEIFAHASGTNVRDRSRQKTSQQQTRDRIDEMTDKYKQDMLRYNSAYMNAQNQDFANQLRFETNKHQENRQGMLLKADDVRRQSEARQKREWQKADDEDKIVQQREQAQWELENITKPKLKLQDEINAKNQYRQESISSRNKPPQVDKYAFEISVPEGTAGAQYNQHTGTWVLKESLDPARKKSILSNLPGGKMAYAEKNNLYKSYSSKDEAGVMREQISMFSDDEIIQHYLENGYREISPAWRRPQTQPQQQANSQITTQSQPARGNVR